MVKKAEKGELFLEGSFWTLRKANAGKRLWALNMAFMPRHMRHQGARSTDGRLCPW